MFIKMRVLDFKLVDFLSKKLVTQTNHLDLPKLVVLL